MKKFLKCLLWITSVSLVCVILFIFRGKPEISVAVDSISNEEYIIYEAYYTDGSKMPFSEARKILKNKERCTIIPSLDDGILDPNSSDYEIESFWDIW